jgi:branched-chain amino acid aminotransferase
LAQIGSGQCSELFACGTAAIVSPIEVLAERRPVAVEDDHGPQGEYVPKNVDVVAARLREALLAIQERRAPDIFGWTRDVAPLPRAT